MTLTASDTSRTVKTPQWHLHYHEAGSGQPVILLHGSGPGATGWSNFAANIEALSKQFKVYAVDMPGWGQSDACTVDRLDHVEATRQFMDALGLQKAAFVGNSMGGHTSMNFAIQHPQRISHLITMGPPAPLPSIVRPGDGPSEGLKILIQAYRDPSPEVMARLIEIMVFDKKFATPELLKARSDAAKARPEHLKNYLDGLPKGSPIPQWLNPTRLHEIAVPTLLIHGRDDRVVHYEGTLQLLAQIPNSRAVLLNRCGHWAMIEHPAEFNRLVADFVAHA